MLAVVSKSLLLGEYYLIDIMKSHSKIDRQAAVDFEFNSPWSGIAPSEEIKKWIETGESSVKLNALERLASAFAQHRNNS